MDIPKSPSALAKRRRKQILLVGGGVAVLAFTSVALFSSVGLNSSVPRVQRSELWIDTVRKGELQHEIRATGTLIPKHVRWITAEVQGTVQEVRVLPGAPVKADTVILLLAAPSAKADLERARAAHAGALADASVKASELELELIEQEATLARAQLKARLSVARAEAQARAEAAGAVSRMERRQSDIEMEHDRNLVSVEERRLSAMRRNYALERNAIEAKRSESASALDLATRQWEALSVRAGIDGILQQVDVEPGKQVGVGASLARVADQDLLIARLQVPELQAKDLVVGLPVDVDLRSARIQGRVDRIDPAVREGRVAIDVALSGALPAGARPDLSVDGRITVARLPNALSLARPPSASAHGAGVLYVLRDENIAERVAVKYGVASSDRIQVLEGLKPGDRVILSDIGSAGGHPRLDIR
jgi:HlyD family secretion protein